jgi:hypothetical protein
VETADYIVEGRVGVLANDGHELTYGIPGSAASASASVLLSSPVPIPAMPELSVGRRNHQAGTAKIGLFAYDRVTREPVWQAGVKRASSEARDTWILGLGPFQSRPTTGRSARLDQPTPVGTAQDPLAAYSGPVVFQRAVQPRSPTVTPPEVATASHSKPIEPQRLTPPMTGTPLSKPQGASP